MKKGGKRPLQKKIEYISWSVLGVLLLLSSMWASSNFIMGILYGGLISILNFHGLAMGLQNFLGPSASKDMGKLSVMYKYLLRLFITGIALYFILVKTTANIFGLVIGLSTVIISIVLSVVLTFIDKSYLEEV